MSTERILWSREAGDLQGSLRKNGIATVDSLVIKLEHRRQGKGNAIYQAFEQKAIAHGCTHVVIEIHRPNVAGKAFWEQQGFVYNEAACEEYDEYVKPLPVARTFIPDPDNFATSSMYEGIAVNATGEDIGTRKRKYNNKGNASHAP